MVKGENLLNGEFTKSKLWLVDLSGSERVAKTDAQGERLKEAQSINRSLSALGDVISALATKSPHIPFRNSKLTHLLQDSLGGDSKTLMFVQINPNENDVGETLCSLNFASRVRGIELGPAKKQVDGYRQMVEKVKQDIKNKDVQMKKLEESTNSLELKNKAKDMINKNLLDKIKELESQLLIERKLARQHVDSKVAENQQRQNLKHHEQEAENSSCCTPAISRPLTTYKELVNEMKPLPENNSNILTESNCRKPVPQPDFRNFSFPKGRENKPELAEDQFAAVKERRNSLVPLPRKASRAASGRESTIPLPAERGLADVAPLPTTSPLQHENTFKSEDENKDRRSFKKKVMMIRSPLPQTVKRRTLAGLENVRVSIGGSGRGGRRVMVRNNGSRTVDTVVQKEKERGWDYRTTVRNNL